MEGLWLDRSHWHGHHYTPDNYGQVIARACKAVGIPHWHPHRLRHNAATRMRKEFGIETARILLGHAGAGITLQYAEADCLRVMEAVGKIG